MARPWRLGSFTLISGVLTDEFINAGTIGTAINHMVEGFVKAAAVALRNGHGPNSFRTSGHILPGLDLARQFRRQ